MAHCMLVKAALPNAGAFAPAKCETWRGRPEVRVVSEPIGQGISGFGDPGVDGVRQAAPPLVGGFELSRMSTMVCVSGDPRCKCHSRLIGGANFEDIQPSRDNLPDTWTRGIKTKMKGYEYIITHS